MAPKSRILLPKSTGFASGEVISVVSDTELILKKEFGGDSGKGTSRVREKIEEAKAAGKPGLDYKILPHVDQHDMYHLVYKKLTEGGCIGIFPEGGASLFILYN
jgi:glycerol-3-phosphate O-acyltransferase/dihydroxyacetone phosphate acyltransferase